MKPTYNVADYYHETGCHQRIARNPWFETVTLSVIFANAVWIAIDMDHNTSETFLDAHPVFVVADNLFCLFFVSEWCIRFLAFRRKRDGLRDAWFVFDTVMAFMMFFETWVMTVCIMLLSSGGAVSVRGHLRSEVGPSAQADADRTHGQAAGG